MKASKRHSDAKSANIATARPLPYGAYSSSPIEIQITINAFVGTTRKCADPGLSSNKHSHDSQAFDT